jgi:hypothetical protein
MQLIAPDILTEARGLTGAMLGTICVLGIALWLFGWRWHRFWIVSGITLTAGLLGMHSGRAAGGTQIMAIGILLAVSAGMMALELAKVFAFVAGGCGAWLAVQWVFPEAQELWAVFLSGGLFGLLLYRIWTMLLTSLAGVLFVGQSLRRFCSSNSPLDFDAVAMGDRQQAVWRSTAWRWVWSCSASSFRSVASPDDEGGLQRTPRRTRYRNTRDPPRPPPPGPEKRNRFPGGGELFTEPVAIDLAYVLHRLGVVHPAPWHRRQAIRRSAPAPALRGCRRCAA